MEIKLNVVVSLDDSAKQVLKGLLNLADSDGTEIKNKVEAINTVSVEKTETSGQAVKDISVDDIREALKRLKNKKDATAASGLLKALGYGKVSEIPTDEYQTVMDAVNKEIA